MSEKNRVKKDDISLPKKILMILGSLFIALVLWYVGTTQDHTPISKQFTDVPIIYRGEDILKQSGFVMNTAEDVFVDVVLKGYSSEIFAIDGDALVAVIDLSQYNNSGKYNVLPFIEGMNGNLSVTKIDSVDIEIEKIVKKQLLINVELEGKPYRGYEVDMSQIQTAGTVEVLCREELSAKIVSARVNVNVDGKKSTFAVNVQIELLDINGNILDTSDIDMTLENINVTIPIQESVQN